MMLHRRLVALAREVPWHVAGLVALGLLVSGLFVGQGLLLADEQSAGSSAGMTGGRSRRCWRSWSG